MSKIQEMVDSVQLSFGRLTQREQFIWFGGSLGGGLLVLLLIGYILSSSISSTNHRINIKSKQLEQLLALQGEYKVRQQKNDRQMNELRRSKIRLVSLVEDARRDVSVEVAIAVKQRYLAAFPKLDPEKFELSMAVLGAQRHSKVIGIFTRLCVRDKKPAYLAHIARVWRLLEESCQHPALKPIKNWLDIHLPQSLRHNSIELQ